MSENWTQVAQEVADGIAEVGMPCVLRRAGDAPDNPWSTGGTLPTYHDIIAVQSSRKVRDANGSFIGVTQTVLTIGALGVIPNKADYIGLNMRETDVTTDEAFKTTAHQVSDVETLAPAGVAVKYEVALAG